jgi:4-hydroxy-tetrahydrodipicolinate synthase
MSDFKIQGVVPPVVVPLTEDGQLDVPTYESHINRMIEAGVDGLFFLGSSGEVAFSTDERREQIVGEGVRIVNGRVPVIAGCIDTETDRVIAQAKRMEALGVDALVATAPFYVLQGPGTVMNHFRMIHEAIDLPLLAYDIPVCVHTKLDWRELVQLGKEGVLAGVKDSSGDDVSFRFLILANEDAGHPLSLLTGHEVVVDGAYLGGADGSVPGLANVEPYKYVEQWKAAKEGDWKRVAELQDELARLMMITQVTKGVGGFGAGVGAFKTALKAMGLFKTNVMPHPVEPLDGENYDAICDVLRSCGYLD